MKFEFQKLRQQIIDGTSSVLTQVEKALETIKQTKQLNAFIEVFEQEAINQANALDADKSLWDALPLLGCIVSIKDNICYENHTVSAGSKMLKDFKSSYSSTAVKRLTSAGAIIIGRTNCDEFGMGSTNENSFYGPVKNGYNEALVSGGSSGGAAVSIQTNCCHLAIGSDTGGSVRQPAAFCGTIGFKPSYGSISRWGLISYASSFDQIGFISEDLHLIELALSITQGIDGKDSTLTDILGTDDFPDTKNLKIGYLESAFSPESMEPEYSDQAKNFFNKANTSGINLEPIRLSLLDYVVPCYYILTTAEASSNLGRYDGVRYGHHSETSLDNYEEQMKMNRAEGFGIEVKRRIMSGVYVLSEGYFDVYYQKAQKVRMLIKEELSGLLDKYDAILLPTVSSYPHELGSLAGDPIKMYLSDIYTVLANLTGHSSVNFPIVTGSDNIPLGIQLISKTNLYTLKITETLSRVAQ